MKTIFLMSIAALAMTCSPATANDDGRFQVKLMGTAVLPDGEITDLQNNAIGLPAGSQTQANDNVVPTIALEYFASDNFSVETICCLTQHDIDGAGTIAGAEAVSDAKILPATLTAKYHVTGLGGIKPYVGAGVTYFFFIDEGPGTTTAALGATRQQVNDKFGGVLQAGADIKLGDSGFGLSLDAKRYFLRTTARWFDAADNEILRTRHKIDPWVLSAGVAYRF